MDLWFSRGGGSADPPDPPLATGLQRHCTEKLQISHYLLNKLLKDKTWKITVDSTEQGNYLKKIRLVDLV